MPEYNNFVNVHDITNIKGVVHNIKPTINKMSSEKTQNECEGPEQEQLQGKHHL